MDRTITISELREALTEVYEKYRNTDVGDTASVDPRVNATDPEAFGIAVTLTDGTVIALGDSAKAVPMTSISKVPLDLTLLTQYKPCEFVEKSGMCKCCCTDRTTKCGGKPKVPVSAKGIRAMSMLQPEGDPDGKWDILSSTLFGLAGSELSLCDRFYERMSAENVSACTENLLADAEFYLYDDAKISIDLYTKLSAMTASAEQLSAMGATIAADGYNPLTKANVFDGTLSQRIVALMAAKGPHKMAKPWLILTGLPAVSSYAGTIMGVLPGVMGIAAYSPLTGPTGVSVKSAKAIAELMDRLQLSALGSARVKITAD